MPDEIRHIDLSKMSSIEQLRSIVQMLMNMVETLSAENAELKNENQKLKDTIKRLKGEQGRPKFTGSGKKPNKDISSQGKEKGGGTKNNQVKAPIPIDRRPPVLIPEAGELPPDATLKFYKTTVVQDLLLRRDNVEYSLAVYHSPSLHTTFEAPLPLEHRHGGYGSNLRALLHVLHRECDVTESHLEKLLASLGLRISSGTISNILLEPEDWACQEQAAILRAGIEGSPYVQTDSTQNKQKGVKMKTHMICAMYFVAYYTLGSKARLDVLKALLGNPREGLQITFNEQARDLLNGFGISPKDCFRLTELLQEGQSMSLLEFDEMMKVQAPGIAAKKNSYARIRESLALGHYHTQEDFPVADILLSDDAPEYQKIARLFHALCWVHSLSRSIGNARHYNKLNPQFDWHGHLLEGFKKQYWTFYGKLLDYRQMSLEKQKAKKEALSASFDRLFNKTTGYAKLDEQIQRTKANKRELLAVLDCPALPLHNNAAELAARRMVRKRDISLHTWSEKGTRVRDAFLTVIETANKLGVSAFHYITDRISEKYEMPSLASLVAQKYAT
jgi:Transposase IS66 family